MMVMKKPWWIVVPLAWAGVVAIVAALAWWVIDGAGQSILTEPAHEAVTPAPTSGPVSPGPNRPEPSTEPPTAPTTGSSTEPTSGPTPSPSSPDSSAPPAPPSSEPQEQPTRRTMTWQGEAGLLRVSCNGQTLRLEGASPHDGYFVDEAERGDGREIEVKFRSTDGDREVEIHVVCVKGVPDFTVEQSGDDD